MTYGSRPGAPGGGQCDAVHVTLPRRDLPHPPSAVRSAQGPQNGVPGARRAGDMAGVSDCNIIVRRHPHA
ncbi:hypothetical protein GCM10010425_22810 [Streptomyces spororaveus]|uniref:hypothetical protein n=1 Tax=Streptomyces spororaveus TaxID=284039 RepID=UPI0031E3B4D7